VTVVDFKRGTDIARAIAVQPGTGGKILVAGSAYVNDSVFGVVRLNPDGTLDTTFGGKASGGKATASPGPRGTTNLVYSMAVLPDGRFVVAGLTKTNGSYHDGSLSLARFNANGTLDTTFGNNGTVLTTITLQGGNHPTDHPVNV